MKYMIQYSKASLRDLDRVWSEVFEASKDYDVTGRYMDGLLDKVESKSVYPESGSPLCYEELFTGYSFVVFKAYLAFYHIENDSVIVDRVLFEKSDYLKRLGLETEEE